MLLSKAEAARGMSGRLTYLCPESKKEVVSTIDTDQTTLRDMGAIKLSLWCPHCWTSHQIGADQASIERSNGPQDEDFET